MTWINPISAPDAAVELDKLVALLKQYPDLKIELSSYTDSRASDQYNMDLSTTKGSGGSCLHG